MAHYTNGFLEECTDYMGSIKPNIPLYYNKDENLFEDAFGWVVYEILSMISPRELLLFKSYKKHMFIYNFQQDIMYELIYPGEGETDERY